MTASFDRVVDALEHAGCLPPHLDGRDNGRLELQVRCPAHEDRSPSLSVRHEGDRTLVHCFAGCSPERVVETLGLALADLYDRRRNTSTRAPTTQAEELAALLRLDEAKLSIKGARIVGRGAAASADLYLSDSTTITFESLHGHFAVPKRLAVEIVAATGAPCPVLSLVDVMKALALLRGVAEHVEATSADDVAVEWGTSYLQATEAVSVDIGDREQRWAAFEMLDQKRCGVVLVHVDGTRYVRSGWFFDQVRLLDHAAGSNAAIAARMERVGWARRGKTGRIKATSPNFPRQLVWSFFEVAAGWEGAQGGDE